MRGHVVFYSVLLTSGLFCLALRAAAQSLVVFGPSPEARECHESATNAVEFGDASPQALEACDTALFNGRLESRDQAATYVNRGILSAALEEYENALEDYDTAMDLHPEFGAIYVNRGNVFFIRGAYDSAISQYTRSLMVEMREYQVPHLNRGMAYEILHHWEAAEADYLRALAFAPHWELAKSKLARVRGKRN